MEKGKLCISVFLWAPALVLLHSIFEFPKLNFSSVTLEPPSCPGYFSDELEWNWQTSQSPDSCLNNTDKLFYFIGNSITRGEFFSMACQMQTGLDKSDACLFSGASRKLRERQMHLCPKNKFRSRGWKPGRQENIGKGKRRVDKSESGLQNAFSCYFKHSGIVMAYRWVDSLEEYLNALKITSLYKPDAISIQIALQTAEEILKPANRSEFFKKLELIFKSNGLSGDQIYMRSIDPVVSGENKKFAYLNAQILNWSKEHGIGYVDSWSMLYSKRSHLYADEVHPDKLATKAKLDCLLWMFCSKN